MPRLKLMSAVAGTLALAGCLTDPFGMKPEANVRLPETPAAAEAPAPVAPAVDEAAATEIVAAPEAPAAPAEAAGLQTDMGPGPVPWTDRLVRGLPNEGSMPIAAGKTLTLALGANRDSGYVWQLDPLPEGLDLVGDYYREAGTDSNRPSWATLRYFMFRSDTPGTYSVHVRHTNGANTRVEKDFVVEVTAS
ncbi:MAG TPA: protease inhibitor I42 family protein [Hyphomonas sp.]|nr:protease inhibitor I42 family protein [Hyphomonas sp.]